MDELELEIRRKGQRRHREQARRREAMLRMAGMAGVLLAAVLLVMLIRSHGRSNGSAAAVSEDKRVHVDQPSVSESNTQTETKGVVSKANPSIAALAQPVTPDPNSVIYLTFDDGPSSEVTPALLDVLEENEVQATFFILNYTDEMLPILRREVKDGHTIAMHAWDHDYSKCYTEENAYFDGINQLKQKVYQDTGYTAFCFRFPGGSSNTISRRYNSGIMTRLTQQSDADPNWEYYDWNVDSTDASGNNRDADLLANSAIKELQKGQHNVILCHDTNSKTTTVEAVRKIIEYGRSNGYVFSGIRRDTPAVHHGVNN